MVSSAADEATVGVPLAPRVHLRAGLLRFVGSGGGQKGLSGRVGKVIGRGLGLGVKRVMRLKRLIDGVGGKGLCLM